MAKPVKRLTGKQLWEMFQETGRRFKETDKMFQETNRKFEETDRRFKETDRKFEETDKKFEKNAVQIEQMTKTVKRISRDIGALHNRLGELSEHLMSPALEAKFKALGYQFDTVSRDRSIKDEQGNFLVEIDVFLENGDYALAVEVKTKLSYQDIDDHQKRMEILRCRADTHQDKRKYLGAVAGVVIQDEIKRYAFKTGLYVIEPSGKTVEIRSPEQLKIW